MKRMTVPAILATAILAFTLIGCSGGNGGSQPVNEDTLKGVWALDSSSDLGFEAYINFEDDSVVEFILADSWLEGTWSASGSDASVTFDESKVALSYNSGKLTLGSSDGSKLVFTKDDSEDTAELFAYGDNAEIEELEYVDEVINPIDPVVIADDDKFAITVTGKGTDFTGDPGYQVTLVNKTNAAVFFTSEDLFNVGGIQVEAGLGDELEPGETLETFIYFDKGDMGGGAETITTTDGTIVVLDDETEEELARYTFHMD